MISTFVRRSLSAKQDSDRKKKRPLQSAASQSPTKKKKVESSFSSLVKKVSKSDESKPAVVPPGRENGTTSANGEPVKAPTANKDSNERKGKVDRQKDSVSPSLNDHLQLLSRSSSTAPKKAAKRVKWADHFGGKLDNVHENQGGEAESSTVNSDQANVSWSDRKKRDRLREKELLAKAK